MQFVKTGDLKIGMRLARPIFNKQGVLLYEQDSKLNAQTVESVRNFGLLGIFILEPAEPVPPMSDEDIAFERFQAMTVLTIQEELEHIMQTRKSYKLHNIAGIIIKNYGHLEKKTNFYQNLRSKTDYVYKHAMNVAILCTMISHVMNIRIEEQTHTVYAALLHDIGRVNVYKDMKEGADITQEQQDALWRSQLAAGEIIESCMSEGISVNRICNQAAKAQMNAEQGHFSNTKLVNGAKILLVANKYDEMTAMRVDSSNKDSEVRAIKELLEYPEIYDPAVVNALIKSINILYPGVSVELNTGEKAVVLAENEENILRPLLLSFQNNKIIDMTLKRNRNLKIKDIMKTLDNRYVIDKEALEKAGFQITT